MEPPAFATRDEFWQLAADISEVKTCQMIHSDRIQRLERRQDDDARMKSVWGASSPFPGVLSATPSSEPLNPQAEAFTLDQSNHLLRNLQLDPDDEPRRGTSRANSVRFDESAMQGHLAQGSRSSGDFLPQRTGSSLGGHLMTERSTSHRSEGRFSLTGNSAHSTRANSLGMDVSRPNPEDLIPDTMPLPPGLFILGAAPSIIRCWLQEHFSNETLLYCSICTGASTSTLDFDLIKKLGFGKEISKDQQGKQSIKLPVFFPEATVIQYRSKSNASTPQVPALTVEFQVIHSSPAVAQDQKRIQIFLGSDTLRAHNADLLFSRNILTLYDDDRDKLSIPLVRPEDDALFKNLVTTSKNLDFNTEPSISEGKDDGRAKYLSHSKSHVNAEYSNGGHDSGISVDDHVEFHRSSDASNSPPQPTSPESSSADIGATKTKSAKIFLPSLTNGTPIRKGPSAGLTTLKISTNTPGASEENSKSMEPNDSRRNQATASSLASISPSNTNGFPSRSSPSGIWGSWRRESPNPDTAPSDTGVSPVGFNRGNKSGVPESTRGRGKTMKVLRPSRSSISKSFAPTNGDNKDQAASKRLSSQDGQWRSSDKPEKPENSSKEDLSAKSRKASAKNPVGGGSAFAWLSPAK